MFDRAGEDSSVKTFTITGLDDFDTSKVTNMRIMFQRTGYNATTWNIGDLSNWNTSNVTNMKEMFLNAGYTATNWNQNLSNWNVNNVTTHTDFNTGSESKVTSPTWTN